MAAVVTHRRVCPACAARYGGHVDPGCPVCGGDGSLRLGERWIEEDEPQVVARAIGMYLGAIVDQPDSAARRKALGLASKALCAAGFMEAPSVIVHPSGGVTALPDPPRAEQRRMGRAASHLAKDVGRPADIVSFDEAKARLR